VVDQLRSTGAVFVDELWEVPDESIVIFSAHGVSRAVQQEAADRNITVFDATCPLVTKVHSQVARYGREGKAVILIGHAGHPEVEGTLGRATGEIHLVEAIEDVDSVTISTPQSVAYVTQTTLSVDDTKKIVDHLKIRFPAIEGPRRDDICYATQNRQDAVKKLAESCELILVVGSENSSNSNRLREIAERQGRTAYLIDNAKDIQSEWISKVSTIGITAGASAPEALVANVIEHLEERGGVLVNRRSTVDEGVSFTLPPELKDLQK
jgi:4-hydroxy-3-methylbut-2-enyl diphosphate reductase